MEHDRRGIIYLCISLYLYGNFVFQDIYVFHCDFVFQGNSHLSHFDQLKFLVLDEADRMVERGHFAELKDILHKINGQPLSDGCKRQKLVFSATLTLPKKKKRKGKKDGGQDTGIGTLIVCICVYVCVYVYVCVCTCVCVCGFVHIKQESTPYHRSDSYSGLCSFCLFVEELISLVGLADDASIVDLTSHQVTVNTLTEARINCTTEQKVVILYGNPYPVGRPVSATTLSL